MSKSTAGFPQASHDFHAYNNSETTVYNDEPSLTRQEFAEECDINSLMKRYEGHAIGGPGNMPAQEPLYFDFAEMPQDLMGYLEFMDEAQANFMRLPAVVRKEFDNSAIEFVAFASDPGNIDAMREWGLAAPRKPAEPPAAPLPSSEGPAAPPPPKAP